MNFEEITPHSEDAESALLSIALQWPQNIDKIEGTKKGRDLFFLPQNKDVYDAAISLKQESKTVEMGSLCAQLESSGILESVGGRIRLADLFNDAPSPAMVDQYLGICQNLARRRDLISAVNGVIRDAYDRQNDISKVIESLDTAIRKLLEESSPAGIIGIRESLIDTVDLVQSRMESGGEIPGISTGFSELDEMTNGFQKGQLWVIGARPGVGKTALGLQFSRVVADSNEPVLFCSAEMEHHELSGRAISAESGIEGLKLLRGDLQKSDFAKISKSLDSLSRLPIYIIDRAGMGMRDIQSASRQATRDHGVTVIVVDYLQLLQEESGSRNREDAVRRLSNGLKNLAKELGVCVIALAQLNRASAKRSADDPPNLSDLRDSGSIEQDANVVLLLNRKDDQQNGQDVIDVDLIVAKCRGGRIGKVELEYHCATTSFSQREYF